MAVTTVTGKINKDELGITLAHEHLFIDLRGMVDKPAGLPESVFGAKLALHNRREVYRDPYRILDNAVIEDETVLLKELLLFKAAGGNSIVDCTPESIGRNPEGLKRLSVKSGVNIIMGCGEYIAAMHGARAKKASAKELAADIIHDINIGAGETGIKAGVIGEIGTSAVIAESEWRAVEAAGLAHLETGKAIHIHTSLWEDNGAAVCDRLIGMGVKPGKIAVNHIDVKLREDYSLRLLDKGVFIEFDNFGKEYYIPARAQGVLKGRFAYDFERAQLAAKLIEKGYGGRILLTNDICLKSLLAEYGGNGYAHVLETAADMLPDLGIGRNVLNDIFTKNVAEFLD